MNATQERNAATERAELATWETQPDRFVAYFEFPHECASERSPRLYRRTFSPLTTGARVTTWPGTTIGYVVSARVYGHNFGARMVSIRVRGTNGASYHGRASWDNGTIVTLRKSKGGR